MAKEYHVYIMGSVSGTLYTGVTNNLERRVLEHTQHVMKGFTDRYNATLLLYFEGTSDVGAAILREKEIKGWRRQKKKRLIDSMNPQWEDLAAYLNAG